MKRYVLLTLLTIQGALLLTTLVIALDWLRLRIDLWWFDYKFGIGKNKS